MSIIQRFKAAAMGRRLGPGTSAPARLDDEREALFIVRQSIKSKWADVEYYGPGAKAAEARREAPSRETSSGPVPSEDKAPTKRPSLRERWRRLKAELNEHEQT